MKLDQYKRQVVHTTGLFKKDELFNDERFMRIRCRAMHSGVNRNKSKFSKECIEAAKDTFKNIPILADVREYTDEHGNKYLDYAGHTMHVEEDRFNEGSERVIYDEKVVGFVPESNDFELVYDEDTERYYLELNAVLLREYGNYCCDILEARNFQTDCSMEIACDDLSFSVDDGVIEVGKMKACGLTLLGADVKPGMEGAYVKAFSLNEDSRQTQLLQIMQELKQSLDNYIQASDAEDIGKKGGTSMENEELMEQSAVEELTENVNETIAKENSFETLLESETENVEVIEESSAESASEEENSEEEEVAPEVIENVEDAVVNTQDELMENESSDIVIEDTEEQMEALSAHYSIGNKNFEVSLDEIQYALNTLINETYGESDNTWYSTIIYSDSKSIVMIDCWTGKAYRQTYKERKGSYSLTGDRVPVKSCWLTEDEERQLDEMRSKYTAIYAELDQYKKIELLSSNDYRGLSSQDEFMALSDSVMDKTNEMTFEELKNKCDSMLLSYAKSGMLDFSNVNEKKKIGSVNLPKSNKRKKNYGSLFDGI